MGSLIHCLVVKRAAHGRGASIAEGDCNEKRTLVRALARRFMRMSLSCYFAKHDILSAKRNPTQPPFQPG
jgi:hypothetical protein